MKKTLISIRAMTALGAIAITHALPAADFTWSGASGANLFWSTPANWSPSGLPGTNDNVLFIDTGMATDTVTINNTLTANTTIRSLALIQTNGVHNLSINPGVTLTIRGTNHNGFGPLGSDPASTAPNPNVQSTVYVGRRSNNNDNLHGTNTISGEGGALVLDNPNNELNIREISGDNGATPPVLHGGGARRAVLDMSGLGSFTANLGRIRIGDGEANPIRRAEGQLWLAKTNVITLTGTNFQDNVQLVIGNNDVNNNGNNSVSRLVLGQLNTLNVDRILVGARKQQGNISFNPNATAPSLRLRGSDGTSRTTALRIGDQSDQSASGNTTTGTIDLSAGTVDIMADRVIIATSQSSAGSAGTGNLTLGAGTLDANSIEMATQLAGNITVPVTANLNVNGTAVMVNDLLRMGRSAGGTGARNANLNINGGSVTVRSNFVTQGTASINITNGTLALTAQAPVLASVVNLDGGTISNAASLRVTNTFNIANAGAILGNPGFDMGNSGSASWNVEGAAGGGLTVSNSFQGGGNYSGNLVQAPGATLNPGGSSLVGTLAVQTAASGGNLTLNNNGILRFDLSNNGLSGNDQITVTGTLTANGTNDVILTSLGGAFDTANPYTLITAGTLTGNQNNFRIAGALAQSRYTFTFDTTSTPNSVKLVVGGTGPSSLTWVGDGAGNVWDAKGVANWTTGAASQFFSLDAVTFNDSGSANNPITMVGTLNSGAVTVNNPTKNYTFGGTGGLSGATLLKNGAGSLTFNNTSDNSFSGTVTISNGAVTFANTGLNTFAGGLAVNGGSLTLSGSGSNNLAELTAVAVGTGASMTVANSGANNFNDATLQLDGTLTFNQTVDASVNGAISGGGTLIKNGTGTLTLGGNNAGLISVIQVNAGTLRAGLAGSLGGGGVTIANGAKLNLNGFSFSALPVIANGSGPDGSGAVVNTAAPQANALGNLTLAGNTSVGGSGPWSTDPVLNSGMWGLVGSLSTSGQAHNFTKTGLNEVIINNTTVDAALGDIDVQQGLLTFAGTTDTMGNVTRTLTARAGATVGFSSTTAAWDKRVVLFGNGTTPSLLNYNGANTIVGPVTLNGDCVVGAVPFDRGNPISLTLGGTISGSGSLIKPSQDTLILGGTNNYTGATVVNKGTLALSGNGSIATSTNITIAAGAALDASLRTDGTFTLASGQTLRGNGTVNGILIAATGSTIASGASVGSLSVTGAVTLRGTVAIELNAATGTNDVISSETSIVLDAAVISISNLAGTLSDGATFKLFDAPAGQLSGTFTMQPTTPGPGQTWNTSTLAVDGTLKVVGNSTGGTTLQIAGIQLSGSDIIVNGTGGTPNGNYIVLTNGNVALATSNWGVHFTRQFDGGGNFNFTNTHSLTTPQIFYRVQVP